MRTYPGPRVTLATMCLVSAAAAVVGFIVRRGPPVAARRPVTATVVVYDEGLPFAGRKVVFHDASGDILSVRETGPDGRAVGDVTNGGMVTVAMGGSKYDLVTVLDVREGDELVFGEKSRDEEPRVVGALSAKLPGLHAAARSYNLTVGVGATKVTAADDPSAFQILESYLDADRRFTVLAEAMNGEEAPVAYSVAKVPLPEKGEGSAVRLPPWRTDWQTVEVEVLHPPPSATSLEVELTVPSSPGRLLRRHQRAVLDAGSSPRLRFEVPPGIGEARVVAVDVAYPSPPGAPPSASTWTRRSRDAGTVVTCDLTNLLPRVSSAHLQSTSDVARPLVAWSVDGAVEGADLAMAVVEWPETAAHRWTVVAPPAQRSWHMPALPSELADWRPAAGGQKVSVALVDASYFANYDDVRRRGIEALEQMPDAPFSLQMSASGKGEL
jgi:hypothetical protein